MSAPLSLDEEARLYTTNAEREKYESLATLYGIIVALDYLERAYVRDSVTAAECVVHIRVASAVGSILRAGNQEVFACVHSAVITIQDYAETRQRRRAEYRAIHESISGKY